MKLYLKNSRTKSPIRARNYIGYILHGRQFYIRGSVFIGSHLLYPTSGKSARRICTYLSSEGTESDTGGIITFVDFLV